MAKTTKEDAPVTIKQDLLTVTGEKDKQKKESKGQFYARVAKAAVKDDPTWDGLGDAAKNWVEKIAGPIIKKASEKDEANPDVKILDTIPDPIDAPPAVADAKKKGKGDLGSDLAGATSPAKSGTEKKKVAEGPSVADTVRRVLCRNPKLTKEEVLEQTKTKIADAKEERVSQIYDATKAVLLILRDMKKMEFKLPGE